MKKIIFLLIVCLFVFSFPWVKFINKNFFPLLNPSDIRIFYYTDIEDLAIAVDKQDSVSICKILDRNPKLVNKTDDVYGSTVLSYAVNKSKYKSIRVLIKYGADPTQGYHRLLDPDSHPIFISIISNDELSFNELLKSSYMSHKDKLIFSLKWCIGNKIGNKYYEPLINLDIIKYDSNGELVNTAIRKGRYDMAIDLLQRGACFKNDVEFKRTYGSKRLLTDYLEDEDPIDSLQCQYKHQFISMLEERGLYKKKEEDLKKED